MNNPNMTDMLRTMMAENPQFQQVIQNNPELGHVLNDPRIMQQTLEMIRNPNMFNEMMRNHDQAMRNIQVLHYVKIKYKENKKIKHQKIKKIYKN